MSQSDHSLTRAIRRGGVGVMLRRTVDGSAPHSSHTDPIRATSALANTQLRNHRPHLLARAPPRRHHLAHTTRTTRTRRSAGQPRKSSASASGIQSSPLHDSPLHNAPDGFCRLAHTRERQSAHQTTRMRAFGRVDEEFRFQNRPTETPQAIGFLLISHRGIDHTQHHAHTSCISALHTQ